MKKTVKQIALTMIIALTATLAATAINHSHTQSQKTAYSANEAYSSYAADAAYTAYAADETSPPSSTQTKNPLIIPKPSTLPGNQSEGTAIRSWVINEILPIWTQGLIGFTAALTFLMMVISGFRYLTSYGNEETATSAKKMLIYSSLGLILAIFSYAIVSIIINIKFA